MDPSTSTTSHCISPIDDEPFTTSIVCVDPAGVLSHGVTVPGRIPVTPNPGSTAVEYHTCGLGLSTALFGRIEKI
jgi:hypothetical protein